MILNKPEYWDNVPANDYVENIKPGGHYLQLLGAEECQGKGANGLWQGLRLYFDCHVTDYQAGAIRKKYELSKSFDKDRKWPAVGSKIIYLPLKDDPKSGRNLKAFINALEASNDGFKYDWSKDFQQQIKDKTIGGVFRDEEYSFDGKSGFSPKLLYFISASAVPDAEKPEPKYFEHKEEKEKPEETATVDDTALPFDL